MIIFRHGFSSHTRPPVAGRSWRSPVLVTSQTAPPPPLPPTTTLVLIEESYSEPSPGAFSSQCHISCSNRFGLNRPPFDRPQLSVFPSPFSLFSRGRWSLSLFKPHLSTFAPECPSALYLFNLLLAVYLECYVIEATKRFNVRSVFLIDKVFACA